MGKTYFGLAALISLALCGFSSCGGGGPAGAESSSDIARVLDGRVEFVGGDAPTDLRVSLAENDQTVSVGEDGTFQLVLPSRDAATLLFHGNGFDSSYVVDVQDYTARADLINISIRRSNGEVVDVYYMPLPIPLGPTPQGIAIDPSDSPPSEEVGDQISPPNPGPDGAQGGNEGIER